MPEAVYGFCRFPTCLKRAEPGSAYCVKHLGYEEGLCRVRGCGKKALEKFSVCSTHALSIATMLVKAVEAANQHLEGEDQEADAHG